MIRAMAAAFVFATLTATAPINSVAPEVTEQSVALAVNVARAEEGLEALPAQNDDLQSACESRAGAVIDSCSPAKAAAGEAIGRAGKGEGATEVVNRLLAVDEYREMLMDEDATQIGVAVETDDYGYPVVIVKTAK